MKNLFSKLMVFSSSLLLVGATFASCERYPEITPEVEQVTNPLTAQVFYISGTVTNADGNGIAGVTVMTSGTSGTRTTVTTSSDGSYQIELKSSTSVDVTFTKTGFITIVSKAVFPSGSDFGANLKVDQVLTQQAAATEVGDDAASLDVSSDEDGEAANIDIPANSFNEGTTISATSYRPPASAVVAQGSAQTNQSSIADVNSPSNALYIVTSSALQSTITASFPVNSSALSRSASVYFTEMQAVKYDNSTQSWNTLRAATFNETTDKYVFTIEPSDLNPDNSIQLGISPKLDVTADVVSTMPLTTTNGVIDNLNNPIAIMRTLTYTRTEGMVFTSISSLANDSIQEEMKSYLETLLGAKVSEKADTKDINEIAQVSGDTKVTVTYTQNKRNYTLSAQTNLGQIDYTVESYGIVNRNVKTETGTLSPDHNRNVLMI